MKLKYILLLPLFFLLSNAFGELFYNPIIGNGQDPWCIYANGYYYLMQTDGGLNIRKAPRLTGSTGLGTVSPVNVLSVPGPNNQEIWAPELHYINGNWYIYFAADDGNDINHRIYVAEANTQDPMGPWTLVGRLYDPGADFWAIDPTILQKADGSLYLIWSGHATSS